MISNSTFTVQESTKFLLEIPAMLVFVINQDIKIINRVIGHNFHTKVQTNAFSAAGTVFYVISPEMYS